MTRGAGFRNADIDTMLLFDPKLAALRADIPEHWAWYTIAYLQTVLQSWAQGQALRVAECQLPGMPPDATTVLRRVGLINGDGRIPAETWQSWYGPAERRRQQLRDRVARHRAGGLADIIKSMS